MKRNATLAAVLLLVGIAFTGIAAAQNTAAPKMSGNWSVKILSTTEGTLTEDWSLKQVNNKISGMVKKKSGELPLQGELTGQVLHASVTEGDKKYDIIATVVGDDIDGTIRMGKNEFLLTARRAK